MVRCFTLILRSVLYVKNINIFVEWELLRLRGVNIVITVLIDWVRVRFVSVVCLISRMVVTYSLSYIRGDKSLIRFILLVALFVLSIILIVLRPNIISILLG